MYIHNNKCLVFSVFNANSQSYENSSYCVSLFPILGVYKPHIRNNLHLKAFL